MFANSTVLMLQKWQTPKFGVVQNFQNTGGPKKGGGAAPPPGYGPGNTDPQLHVSKMISISHAKEHGV